MTVLFPTFGNSATRLAPALAEALFESVTNVFWPQAGYSLTLIMLWLAR